MTITEIWLRLLEIHLPAEIMFRAAQALSGTDNTRAALRNALLTEQQITRFMALNDDTLATSLRWLEQPHHYLITADDQRYPPLLREIHRYPGALFVAGQIDLLHSVQLAVVGSRTHSWYGEHWGRQFCEQLALCGVTITSGLAAGIDAVAHKAALATGGRTLAVLGNGLGHIYPKRHQWLADQILEHDGALISEFPLATTPWPGNFPRRNRIISGLCPGVLVVEASQRSGSLVTARYALEQGREVFALPGPLGNPMSEGTHWLIKQGATPVTSITDIIEQLPAVQRLLLANQGTDSTATHDHQQQISPDALPFASLLTNVGDEATPMDVIAQRSNQPLPLIASQLLELELAGFVAAVPGGYVRLRQLNRR